MAIVFLQYNADANQLYELGTTRVTLVILHLLYLIINFIQKSIIRKIFIGLR